ncbi:tRNA pseudouridine(55) synthase TruB [Metallibacterium scheffleri]|uniref:tRNA pseudouridine synthase B n=1 Tax=Metallibacterium scheffleri TaxID=993689 RepID=A0A4S3KGX7_9GAMM|nr:tRNA pseudouridine(55) synthase TruB [Metallibacterium scheffleri]THD07819.1 tRNA pseudouridine(55) synthase TruB [Metallibacterium scheffleri]
MPASDFEPVHGVLLLDKPLGLSSSHALQRVRRMLGAAKGGHTGALDPLATGMLPLCFGEATKLAGVLLGERKVYHAVCRLGQVTRTDDAESEVICERPLPDLDDASITALLQQFVGRISQVPPIYSALKQQGQPLYRRARRGEAVQAPQRQVEVHALRLLQRHEDRLMLEVECGAGFYVRALARDLGERLGCGGHLAALRRLWVAPFQEQPMIELDTLEQILRHDGREILRAQLRPIEEVMPQWPRWMLSAAESLMISQGRALIAPRTAAPGPCLLLDPGGRALAMAEVLDGRFRVSRGFHWGQDKG